MSVALRLRHQFGDGRDIAQAEIKALRADRRQRVRGFADQHQPMRGELVRGLDPQRKLAASGFDRDLAEDRMGAPLDLLAQRRSVERHQIGGFCRLDDADEARALARQRHHRERAVRGVKFSRDVFDAGGVCAKFNATAVCG